MFKKLVANLPFNPSLIHQIGFYADRLRQEKSIRRLSFVFMALAMAVQSLAVISPPERSLAADSTHIMNGLTTKADILAYYDNSATNVKSIFNHYNLTREDIANLSNTPNVTIKSNDGNDWWTLGTYSLSTRSDVAAVYKNNERQIVYEPGKSVYERQLRAFDIINPYNTYKAWKGVSSATGQTFWILQSCGNLTWIDNWKVPPPPTPDPEPEPEPEPIPDPVLIIQKSIDKSGPLKPGDTFKYRIAYRNSKIGAPAATNVKIRDTLDLKSLTLVSPSARELNMAADGTFVYELNDGLVASTQNQLLEITVRVKDPIANGTEICNDNATISASNAERAKADAVCITVLNPCKYNDAIPDANDPNCIIPTVSCELLTIGFNLEKREANFETKVSTSNDKIVTIQSYVYDFGDGTTQTYQTDVFKHDTVHTYEPGKFTASVVVNYTAPSENGQTKQTVECEKVVSFEEEYPFSQEKTVENITQNLKGDDVVKSKVRAGDELEYHLYTVNTNEYDRSGVVIRDYIGDLLDYATLNEEALKADGGRFDKNTKEVLWENVTIPAKSKLETRFKITLLNPIPATNRPSNQGSDYDCEITNIYGNKLALTVACPAVKNIETIPNTGPGSSLMMAGGITFIVGYFFARSRLLSKELDIIRSDYAVSGGM